MNDRSDRHHILVAELVEVFKQQGFSVVAADGISGYRQPKPLPNDGYGDQEPKAPDVMAFDEKEKRLVLGEAKTGDDDLETEHALTQYNVYLDQFDRTTGEQALLHIIVPASVVAEFNTLITHYIHREYWRSIVVVSSKRLPD